MNAEKAVQWPKIQIGVSSCLLGNRVRHNGEHKANDWLLAQLGPFVSWVAVCPEVEMGLGIPRESMRLVGNSTNPRLVTVRSKIDQTEKASQSIERILKNDFELDGFIFKKDSPTCGLERVKVYGSSGIPAKNGVGLFARSVREKFPKIPMIEEGRLTDPRQREAFLIQIYIYSVFTRLRKSISVLQQFHQRHKLQLMAYDPGKYQKLGQIAANSQRDEIKDVFSNYEGLLFEFMAKPLTAKKYVNVFQHMLGYFKQNLESKEKSHILELIDSYKNARVPLISVSTLFEYLVKKYSVHYLENQSILNPYPREILTGGRI